AARTQASLDLANGPVHRVLHVVLGPGRPERLLFVAHHLAIDGVSWRILADDFWAAYAGHPLPPRTTSFKRWSDALRALARSPDIEAEKAFWLDDARRAVPAILVDHDRGPNDEASARSVVVSLEAAETEALLREVPEAYRTQINDVLLTALGLAFGAPVLVDLEGHGREDVVPGADVTRTLGWLTALFPVLVYAPAGDLGGALKSVKEQLRAVPRRGVGYGLLRYLRDDDIAAALRALPQADVSFNYLGQLDQAVPDDSPFRRARQESAGPAHSPRARRPHLLDVLASVQGGRLGVRFAYSEARHERATVERLAARFLASLRAIVAHCASPGAGGYTPSDFPKTKLDQPTVDRLATRAGGRGSIEDVYPLSPMQEGILFHALYDAGAAGKPSPYFVQHASTIDGPLDPRAFARAWQEVVDRHAALRTAILWEGL